MDKKGIDMEHSIAGHRIHKYIMKTADMNTPRGKIASIEHTEYLWRKHFG